MKDISDIEILEQIAIAEARENFYAYRQYINGKKMKLGWWQEEVAGVLQNFYQEFVDGLCPIYILQAPPQHGKSSQIVDFISWIAGKNPDLKKIYAAFSESLGVRANLRLQKVYDSKKYKNIFPDTKINSSHVSTASGQYSRNRGLIEYVDNDGYFRNTTVRGAITGEELDVGIIDDPIKGRAAANSKTVRDSTWDWFTDDFFSRYSESAGTLMVLTRWHVEDPAGMLEKEGKNVKVFRYPAIATENEKHRKMGEALFPEHKSIDFLMKRKEIMRAESWASLYQQNPFVADGEIVKSSWWQFYNIEDKPKTFTKIISSWDLNGEKGEKNDMTVGLAWGFIKGKTNRENRAYLLAQVREQTDFLGQIRMFANMTAIEPRIFKKLVEAKSNGGPLINSLESKIKGIEKIKPVDSKENRLYAVTPYIEGGQVFLPNPKQAPWVNDYIQEHTMFPNGRYDDRVDATSQALYYLFGEYKENADASMIRKMFS